MRGCESDYLSVRLLDCPSLAFSGMKSRIVVPETMLLGIEPVSELVPFIPLGFVPQAESMLCPYAGVPNE